MKRFNAWFNSKLAVRPSDPLFITREEDVFFILVWVIFAGWGWTSVASGVPTIVESLGVQFNFIWALMIAVASTFATIAATSLFFRVPKFNQVRKKRVELSAIGAMFFLTAIYPIYLGILVAGGDDTRTSTTVLALLYPTVVAWRGRSLLIRVRNFHATS